MAPTSKIANIATATRAKPTSSIHHGSIFDLDYGSAGKGLLTRHPSPPPAYQPIRKAAAPDTLSLKDHRLAMWGDLLRKPAK
ncbi:hypothetical protein [Falsirhodobacter xinxiangensis]|uniref:hypothetical protein n=1 Tax=Falsirhodobacter xinxiangensis TaxID=2530049 RepID=UPI0010AAB050|nr:hypothetical protein [Rhodobacter xinxiangensis]